VLLFLQAHATPRPSSRPATSEGQAGNSSSSRPSSPFPAAATAPVGYQAPGTKLLNPQLQARLLRVIAAVLSQPCMVDAVLKASPQLPRLLMHMFAPSAGPLGLDIAEGIAAGSTAGGTSTVNTADPYSSMSAAAPSKGGAGATTTAPAAKSTVQTPRSSAAVNTKGASGTTAQQGMPAAQLSNSGAATPRRAVTATKVLCHCTHDDNTCF